MRETRVLRARAPRYAAFLVLGTILATALLVGGPRWILAGLPVQAQQQVVSDGAPIVEPRAAVAGVVSAGADVTLGDFWVHVPAGAPEPLTVVVALHGMAGSGREIAEGISQRTDARGWAVVAPTFTYGDWRDPGQVTREAQLNLPAIASLLDELPDILGTRVRDRVYLFGYSRGAQEATRFALLYPERVAGVAALSAGTYTLPLRFAGDSGSTPLRFPFGVGNLREVFGRVFDATAFAAVPFWIGVGARDSNPADVPHEWDSYLGGDRLERAQRYAGWLRTAGVKVGLRIYPGVGHSVPEEMRSGAMDFFAEADGGR